MADRHVDHVLIGGGTASANCARHLRENSDDSILLIGREPEPPYHRPALTKAYLAAAESREMEYFRPAEFWEEQRIELMTRTSVVGLDAEAHEITLMNKQVISYGKALIATGCNVNLLHVPGMGQEGIHYLRVFGNSDSILDDLGRLGRRVALVGGGFIGCEVAATLARHGCECSIVMPEDLPMQGPLGDIVGGWTKDRLEQLGVTLHPGQSVERFDGDGERVTSVVCESGLAIECDLVVIGVGVHPETRLAQQAGIELGERGGILTDAQLRSSAPEVFAAGDVAEWYSNMHRRHIRVEHWDVALNHGKTAALNMLGGEHPHDVVPYFWSDIADFEIEVVGPAYEWDRVVVRGSVEDSAFSAWYVRDARVVQVAAVGSSDDLQTGRTLIASGKQLDDQQFLALADPGRPLEQLV